MLLRFTGVDTALSRQHGRVRSPSRALRVSTMLLLTRNLSNGKTIASKAIDPGSNPGLQPFSAMITRILFDLRVWSNGKTSAFQAVK